MRKICIIGNSHIGALKSAWDGLHSEWPGIEITFFGALTPVLRAGGPVVSEGCLKPSTVELRKYFSDTSGGLEDICGQYDAYLVCGLRFGSERMENICSHFRAETHFRDGRRPVSDECYLAITKGYLSTTQNLEMVAKVRQITAAPVWVLPTPMPSDASTGTELDKLEEVGDDKSVRNMLFEAMRQLVDEKGFRLLLQPEVTLSRPLKTKSIYTRGALKLTGGMKEPLAKEDYKHMNGDYGSLILRPWLATLSESAGAQEDRTAFQPG
jgi:hypothetical protein